MNFSRTVSIGVLLTGLLALAPVGWALSVPVPVVPHETATELIQDSEYLPLSRASALLTEERQAEALPYLVETLEQNPINLLGLFHLGNAYLDLAKQSDLPAQQLVFLNQSQQAFERVVNLNPDLVLSYFKLGKIALMRGDVESARLYYEQGLAVEPDNAALIFNLARVYDQEHKREQAIEYYLKTIAVDPGFIYAYNNLGLLYEEAHDAENAEKYYRMALKKNRDYNLARLNLGNLFAAQGQLEAASRYLTEAQAMEPSNPWTHYYLGNLFLRQGRYDEAVTAYQKALSLNPDHSTTYYLLAVTLSKLNRMDEALQASLHYVQLAPNGEFAKEMKSLIMAVKLSQSNGLQLVAPAAALPAKN